VGRLRRHCADAGRGKFLIGQPEHAQRQAELDALLKKKLAEQRDEFRPGPEYVKKWGYQVDENETVRYRP
jgi:hypothetical protein